jgi:hypothetical protein
VSIAIQASGRKSERAREDRRGAASLRRTSSGKLSGAESPLDGGGIGSRRRFDHPSPRQQPPEGGARDRGPDCPGCACSLSAYMIGCVPTSFVWLASLCGCGGSMCRRYPPDRRQGTNREKEYRTDRCLHKLLENGALGVLLYLVQEMAPPGPPNWFGMEQMRQTAPQQALGGTIDTEPKWQS